MSRVIVITGGHGALGRTVAKVAAGRGWRVAVIDHAPGEGDLVRGGVDLTDPEAAAQTIDSIAAETGAIHALVNIAGGFTWETVGEGALASWERMYALNVKTALNASKAATPHLIAAGEGRIVNVGANAALKAATGMGAYAAAKSGVHRLTETLAEELKDKGVTVNAVLPSIIDTPANRADMPDADASKWVKAEDLAAVILFLASPEARAVTGVLVPVTGRV